MSESRLPNQFHVGVRDSAGQLTTIYVGARKGDAAIAFFDAAINNVAPIVITVRTVVFQSTGAAHVAERIVAELLPKGWNES